MKRRIFALMIALVMALCLLPAAALAAEPVELREVEVRLTEPAAGARPDYDAVLPADAGYTAAVAWFDDNSGERLVATDSFAAGGYYILNITFTPKDGYVFAGPDKLTGTLNGTGVGMQPGDGGTVWFQRYFDVGEKGDALIELSHVEVRLTEPAAGAKPDLKAVLPEDAGYTAVVAWFDDNSGKELAETDSFAAGGYYILNVTFTPKEGYVFATPDKLTGTLNGTSVGMQPGDGGTAWFQRYFDVAPAAPEKEDVWKIHFHPNGGGSGTWEWGTVKKGEMLTLPENPYIAPVGYRFGGWDRGQPGAVIAVDGDMEIFAQWEALPMPLADVPEDAWYAKDVRTAYFTGLVNGKTATSFEPAANITYAETVKLAACMQQLYTSGEVTLTNGSPNWYDSYAAYARENGIINKDYDWNAQATRKEFVEIFAHALPEGAYHQINDVPDDRIPDVKAAHPQAESIYLFYRAGILNGYPTEGETFGEFRPDNTITRAEVAAILTRMMYAEYRVSV
jgi:hypothetical protein